VNNPTLINSESISIEICDARITPPKVVNLLLSKSLENTGYTVGQALLESGLAKGIDDPRFSKKGSFGVFGIRQNWGSPLYEGDRVEIYAPLIVDPKHSRRKKANQNKDAQLQAKARLKASEKQGKSKI
jgi:putative ubiquitin-RnfH superfamily antitoxin RatB of RatAB toxin-antitoxin module